MFVCGGEGVGGGGGGAGECKQIVLGYSLLNFLLKPGKEFGVRFY